MCLIVYVYQSVIPERGNNLLIMSMISYGFFILFFLIFFCVLASCESCLVLLTLSQVGGTSGLGLGTGMDEEKRDRKPPKIKQKH